MEVKLTAMASWRIAKSVYLLNLIGKNEKELINEIKNSEYENRKN